MLLIFNHLTVHRLRRQTGVKARHCVPVQMSFLDALHKPRFAGKRNKSVEDIFYPLGFGASAHRIQAHAALSVRQAHIGVNRQAVFFERRLIAQRSVNALRHRARLECFSHAGLALYVDIYLPAVAGPESF